MDNYKKKLPACFSVMSNYYNDPLVSDYFPSSSNYKRYTKTLDDSVFRFLETQTDDELIEYAKKYHELYYQILSLKDQLRDSVEIDRNNDPIYYDIFLLVDMRVTKQLIRWTTNDLCSRLTGDSHNRWFRRVISDTTRILH